MRASRMVPVFFLALVSSQCDNLGEVLEALAKKNATSSSSFSITGFSPANGSSYNSSGASVNGSVTFSDDADSSTLTAQTTAGTCSGNVQLSTDDFGSCKGFPATPTTADNRTFNFSFESPGTCGGTVKIKFLTGIKSKTGSSLNTDVIGTSTDTFCP